MAPDTQWPSEDEDFDAVAKDVADRESAQDEQTKPATKVTVADADDANDTAADSEAVNDTEAATDATSQTDTYQTDKPVESKSDAATEEPEEPEEPEQIVQSKQLEQPLQASESPQSPKTDRQALPLIAISVLLVVIVGLGLWGMSLKSDNQALRNHVTQLNNNPQLAVQKQTDALIAKVGSLIDLPKGETPTVANVSDAAKAKQQSTFFNNAQNGDRVLMYVKAGQAILYRPSTEKIVLVAPLTFNDTAAAKPAVTPTTTGTNGSTTNR